MECAVWWLFKVLWRKTGISADDFKVRPWFWRLTQRLVFKRQCSRDMGVNRILISRGGKNIISWQHSKLYASRKFSIGRKRWIRDERYIRLAKKRVNINWWVCWLKQNFCKNYIFVSSVKRNSTKFLVETSSNMKSSSDNVIASSGRIIGSLIWPNGKIIESSLFWEIFCFWFAEEVCGNIKRITVVIREVKKWFEYCCSDIRKVEKPKNGKRALICVI